MSADGSTLAVGDRGGRLAVYRYPVLLARRGQAYDKQEEDTALLWESQGAERDGAIMSASFTGCGRHIAAIRNKRKMVQLFAVDQTGKDAVPWVAPALDGWTAGGWGSGKGALSFGEGTLAVAGGGAQKTSVRVFRIDTISQTVEAG